MLHRIFVSMVSVIVSAFLIAEASVSAAEPAQFALVSENLGTGPDGKIAHEVTINADFNQTLAAMVRAGRFTDVTPSLQPDFTEAQLKDWKLPDTIDEEKKNHPASAEPKAKGKQDVTFALFSLKGPTTVVVSAREGDQDMFRRAEEKLSVKDRWIAKEARRLGYRPATLRELLVYAAKGPTPANGKMVLALGTTERAAQAGTSYLYFMDTGAGRNLNFIYQDGVAVNMGEMFLMVKVPIPKK